ncbi:MAG TPA: hypothetical protein VHY10_10070 [Xanthobacteraceae bacterium]|jgi:hypothetical protein|nr:hypothetical protein [Xanthobacteraceae bacterium]
MAVPEIYTLFKPRSLSAMQRRFLGELWRVARKGIFVTTPNGWFPIEFHSVLRLLQWLPPALFRRAPMEFVRDFFVAEDNLNLLTARDLARLATAVGIDKFRIASVALLGRPTNLLLCAERHDAAQR